MCVDESRIVGFLQAPGYRALSPAGRPEWPGHNSNWTQLSWSGPLQVWLCSEIVGKALQPWHPASLPTEWIEAFLVYKVIVCESVFQSVNCLQQAEAVEHPISTYLSSLLHSSSGKCGQASSTWTALLGGCPLCSPCNPIPSVRQLHLGAGTLYLGLINEAAEGLGAQPPDAHLTRYAIYLCFPWGRRRNSC